MRVTFPVKSRDDNSTSVNLRISSLDEIGQMAFRGIKQLNPIQSTVFETAYNTSENMLVCAPTGDNKIARL